MQNLIRGFALLIVIALVSLPLLAAADGVKQVPSKHVCFITGKRYDKTLPAEVINGKKYYYCHEDCFNQLKSDPATRTAIDPMSGVKVDKADAVVGVDKNGNVFYFENMYNLHKFRVSAGAIPTGE